MALYARLNSSWKWNARGSKILSEKGWRSQCGWQNYCCTVNNTNFGQTRHFSVRCTSHLVLLTWKGSFPSVCIHPKLLGFCFDLCWLKIQKFLFFYLEHLMVLFTLPDLLCDSNYLRGERRILAIKKRQSAFLKYSLSGLIQDRNTIQRLALTGIKGKSKNKC